VERRARKVKETDGESKKEERDTYCNLQTSWRIFSNGIREVEEDTLSNTIEELPSPTQSFWLHWSQFKVYVSQERLENESEEVKRVRGVGVGERSGRVVERRSERRSRRERKSERERRVEEGHEMKTQWKNAWEKQKRKCEMKSRGKNHEEKTKENRRRKWENGRKCEKMRENERKHKKNDEKRGQKIPS
jgi:hypothetical protein